MRSDADRRKEGVKVNILLRHSVEAEKGRKIC